MRVKRPFGAKRVLRAPHKRTFGAKSAKWASLERDVSVPTRVAPPLFAQRDPQSTDQGAPRAARLDHVVDVAPLGRDVRIREAFRVVRHELATQSRSIRGRVQLAVKHD